MLAYLSPRSRPQSRLSALLIPSLSPPPQTPTCPLSGEEVDQEAARIVMRTIS